MGCIIPLLLLLLLVPLLLYLLPQLSSEPVTTLPPVMPTPMPAPVPTEPYSCDGGGLWSNDKKGWCCQHYGKGCTKPPTPAPRPPPAPVPPMPVPVITTSPCPFDCNQGYNEWPLQWVKGWSAAKKLFCCRTMQRGCPSELPPPSGLPPNGLRANCHGVALTSKKDARTTPHHEVCEASFARCLIILSIFHARGSL